MDVSGKGQGDVYALLLESLLMKRVLGLLLTVLSFVAIGAPCTKTVAAGGNIQTAVNSAVRGDVICLRGGTYAQNNVWVAASGITIMNYPGEAPVLYGDGVTSAAWPTFFTLSGSNIVLSGLEIKNGTFKDQKGVWLRGNTNTVRNMRLENIDGIGILITGDDATVENNTVLKAAMGNKDCAQCDPPYWGFGIGSYISYTGSKTVKSMIIRGNTVSDSWGEGIQAFQAVGALVENNVAHDNFSTNFYITSSSGTVLKNNVGYNTVGKRSARGLTLADEHSFLKSSGTIVTGNYFYNADVALYEWTVTPGSGLKDALFSGNSLIDSELIIGWTGRPPGIVHSNSTVRDNLFYSSQGGSTGTNHWTKGITYMRNLWSPTRPANAEGIGDILP